MTFETALPYVSIGCAVGAAAAAAVGPSPGVQRTLKSLALLSLAVFAFLRGVAPAALAMSLVLSGLAWAASSRERSPRLDVSAVLFPLAWLVLAWLCLREGLGLQALASPLRLGGALLVLVAVAGLVAWARRATADLRLIVSAFAAGIAALAALTLRDGQWPAIAGAAVLLAAHGARLALDRRPRYGRAADMAPWILGYLGQAAMAYVFLR